MFKNKGIHKYQAADKADMTERTAYKYIKANKLPSQLKCKHSWKTRKDPFIKDWPQMLDMLELNPGLEAKTIFNYLKGTHPGRYQDGQLRTLQRKIRYWRATSGPAKEVYFPQVHYPGNLSASDFTYMDNLGIAIQGKQFNHLLYHFVLTYSNWETFTICYSESLESLSAGLQNALWELGGTPKRHRTDRMSAAVNKDCHPEKFNRNYQALLNHYGITPERTNARRANENGDVETSHRHFKRAVDQALMLRGSKDFNDVTDYKKFLQGIARQLNIGRGQRFKEDLSTLRPLPAMRLNDYKDINNIRVSTASTVRVQNNIYSVHSRLIGENVHARIHVDHVEIWYRQRIVDSFLRQRGSRKHRIDYRHIIDWLVRKPGAFESYRYKQDLYPSSWFRMTYDWLRSHMPLQANREYVKILYYAAKEGQAVTESSIKYLLEHNKDLIALNVKNKIDEAFKLPLITDISIDNNDLRSYDSLLQEVVSL
ncbi:IS21 family transposase [Candidatus Omnitrophota bacterium]